MALDKWMEAIGRKGSATSSRWIAAGMIKPINILGKHFVTREEDERFWKRAAAGEFKQEFTGVIADQKSYASHEK